MWTGRIGPSSWASDHPSDSEKEGQMAISFVVDCVHPHGTAREVSSDPIEMEELLNKLAVYAGALHGPFTLRDGSQIFVKMDPHGVPIELKHIHIKKEE